MLNAELYDLINQGVRALFLGILPVVVLGLVVGLISAAFQSVSSIHEVALSYGLKLIAVSVALYLILPSMAQSLLGLLEMALR